MADRANTTPAPDVHPFAGSSPPGAGAPGFEPVAGAADPPTADFDEDDDALASRIEPDLSRFSPEDQILIQTAKQISEQVRGGATATDVRAQMMTLADLRPRSLIALGMKSDAQIDCLSHLGLESDGTGLGLSIWHDAMRLATASVCPPEIIPDAPQESWAFRDAAFRWAEAEVECAGWFDMMSNIEKMVVERGIPDALWVKPEDQELFPNANRMPCFDEKPWFGHPETIMALRATIEKGEPCPAANLARRLEILNTYDDWSRRSDNARLILHAADFYQRSLAIADKLDDLRTSVMRKQITTLDGLVVKAVVGTAAGANPWGALTYVQGVIDDAEIGGGQGRTIDYLHRDLLRLACSRGMSKETLSGNKPKPVPAPDRDLLESYRAFLHMELQFLNAELGFRGTAARTFWLDNPAGRFHGGGIAQPSTRAAVVLGLFGLLPVAETAGCATNADVRAA